MAVAMPTFTNPRPYNQQPGSQMYNPFASNVMSGMNAMSNLGGLIGGSFALANRQNSSNRINNNAINAASGGGGSGGGGGEAAMAIQFDYLKELMRQQAESQRQQQKMMMAQQLMGMMGAMPAGPQLAGFGSNFGQGVNLFGTPPAAGGATGGTTGTPAPAPTPGQPGGPYGPYANPFFNDIMGQQMAKIDSLRNRRAQPGQHPRYDQHYGMNLAMGSKDGTTAGIPPAHLMMAGGRSQAPQVGPVQPGKNFYRNRPAPGLRATTDV